MKIIFLDFDGVINTFSHFSKTGNFSVSACKNLNKLLDAVPEARIVVSSAWRTRGLDAVREILKSNGVHSDRVIDITDKDNRSEASVNRSHYISQWLEKHKEIKDFVILDDESNMDNLLNKLVKINSWVGITEADVANAIDILHKSDKIK